MHRCLRLLLILVYLGVQSPLLAFQLRYCNQHWPEIRNAQGCVSESMVEAQKAGCGPFRNHHFVAYETLAGEWVRGKNTYTDLSAVVRDCLSRCKPAGHDIIFDGWQRAAGVFTQMYTDCARNHGHISAYYERGRISFDMGNYEACIADLTTFVSLGGSTSTYSADLLLAQGQAFNELLDYDRAIDVLTQLIEKNPKDKEAYFHRAVSYFETGNYHAALADYLKSERHGQLTKVKLATSQEFAEAFLHSLATGAIESIQEFIPSLWGTVRGIGSALWTCAEDPGASLTNYVNVAHEVMVGTIQWMQSVDKQYLHCCLSELRTLADDYNRMSDADRGNLLGYIIGKYGTDLLAFECLFKGGSYLHKLNKANREAMFESMLVSEANTEKIIAESSKHCASREQSMRKVAIEWDKQNKHITTAHNYQIEKNRSILTHPDPQGLLDRFASTGIKRRHQKFGEPGYREVVDFGEIIGYHVDRDTGLKTATTFGEIHYSNVGAHIVPILFE